MADLTLGHRVQTLEVLLQPGHSFVQELGRTTPQGVAEDWPGDLVLTFSDATSWTAPAVGDSASFNVTSSAVNAALTLVDRDVSLSCLGVLIARGQVVGS